MTVSTLKLDKSKRIAKRRVFLKVQKYGKRVFGNHVVMLSHGLAFGEESKFGVTVPKQVGKAHERNLIKRRFRHIVRHNQYLFEKRLLVLIAKPSAKDCSFAELQEDILFAFNKFNFYKKNFKKGSKI